MRIEVISCTASFAFSPYGNNALTGCPCPNSPCLPTVSGEIHVRLLRRPNSYSVWYRGRGLRATVTSASVCVRRLTLTTSSPYSVNRLIVIYDGVGVGHAALPFESGNGGH